ncbi:MAG: hypothetical protein EXX96DRAFT_207631 [Benjaminiella poitrasii]|nr:MAG: hypothetical protein EXX96DRAFT_207631 [Benjaminiella poitrasii]
MASSLLILGGTGLMGTAIIRESQNDARIKQRYATIYALSRTAENREELGATFIQGNALEADSLNPIVAGKNPDVVHTVGTLLDQSGQYGSNGTYDRLNRDAAIVAAQTLAAQKHDQDRRRCFLYFSAATAPPSFLLNERYIQAKREAEEALLSLDLKDKLRVVVFRPGLIYSYHRRQLMLPLALGLIVGSAILKPLSSYMPQNALYFTDRPLLDSEISHAVLQALEDESVEGIYDIERIRQLAHAWETNKKNE